MFIIVLFKRFLCFSDTGRDTDRDRDLDRDRHRQERRKGHRKGQGHEEFQCRTKTKKCAKHRNCTQDHFHRVFVQDTQNPDGLFLKIKNPPYFHIVLRVDIIHDIA